MKQKADRYMLVRLFLKEIGEVKIRTTNSKLFAKLWLIELSVIKTASNY